MSKNLERMSTEQLEKELAARKTKEAKSREIKKQKYETARDKKILKLFGSAKKMSKMLEDFKALCATSMDEQKADLESFGKLRANSKGGFSILSADGCFKIERRLDSKPVWDERCEQAVSMIKDFLTTDIKKQNPDIYELLQTFLERNNKGDMRYESAMKLIQHEDKFTDKRWKQGIQLLKESYKVSFKKFYYVFWQKDAKDNWEIVNLNFSSL